MRNVSLTKAKIEAIPFTDGGQVVYWDDRLTGFGLRVGARTKSFVVQKSGKGMKTLGRFGVLTVEKARKKAQTALGDIAGERLGEVPKITLRQATKSYVTGMRNQKLSDRSIRDLKHRIENYLEDWLDRPLASIARSEVRKRHARIGKVNGPYMANGIFRCFRAVYNDAMAGHDGLPANPCIALRKRWFKETRRQEPVEDLRAWLRKVVRLSPVRRSYHLFVLFTGLRRTDAATVRWEDVDLENGILHRPAPKGGKERAFSVPLNGIAVRLLRRRKRQNRILFPGSPWVFPAESKSGHLEESKEQRRVKGKKVTVLPSPHRLRDTYATAAHEAGVAGLDIKVLLNHRLPGGDVTAGYIRQQEKHLRECQERIAAHLISQLKRKQR